MKLLTPREREIGLLLAEGLCNREIAEKLKISPGTVKIHLHNVFSGGKARNRAHLAVLVSR